MSHSLIWHCICLMNKQCFVRHSLRFIIDYQNDGWLFVLIDPGSGPEAAGQEVQGWRAAAHADSILWGESDAQSVPSRSGSTAGWQRTTQRPPLPVAPRARLELSIFVCFFVFCPLVFFLFQTGLCKLHSRQRAPYKNQRTFSNECRQPGSFIACCDFLVLYFHIHFLFCCRCFFFAHWAAHTDYLLSHLLPFLFSLEGLTPCSHCVWAAERNTHPAFPRQRCNERERECVFC